MKLPWAGAQYEKVASTGSGRAGKDKAAGTKPAFRVSQIASAQSVTRWQYRLCSDGAIGKVSQPDTIKTDSRITALQPEAGADTGAGGGNDMCTKNCLATHQLAPG